MVLGWLACLEYGSRKWIPCMHAAAGEEQGSCRQCFCRSSAHLCQGLGSPLGPAKNPSWHSHKSVPIPGMVCSAAPLVSTFLTMFLALLFVCCAGCVYMCVCVSVNACAPACTSALVCYLFGRLVRTQYLPHAVWVINRFNVRGACPKSCNSVWPLLMWS